MRPDPFSALRSTGGFQIFQLESDDNFDNLVVSETSALEVAKQFNGTTIPPDACRWEVIPSGDDGGKPVGDLGVFCSSGALFASERAYRCLSGVVNRGIQWIEVRSSGKPYWLVNVLTVIDCLDRGRSKIEYWPPLLRFLENGQRRPRLIQEYAFTKSVGSNTYLFKLPEFPVTHLFATDSFVELVKTEQMMGITFRQIWSENE